MELLVLVGPKGAGKSTLGRRLGREPGHRFLDVEPIARQVFAASGGVPDEAYARRAFDAIVEAVRAEVARPGVVVLEATGASAEAPAYLARLEALAPVRYVRLRLDPDTCAARIAARDASVHVPVPAEQVRRMHALTEAVELPWWRELDATRPVEELAAAILGR